MSVSVKLHLGDCLEYMKSMPDKSVDAVITDPPYGTEGKSGYGRGELWHEGGGMHRNIVGDKDLATLITSFPDMLRVGAAVLCFHSAKNTPEFYRSVPADAYYGQIVWDKKNMGLGGKFRYQHELISIFGHAVAQDDCSSLLSYFQGEKEHPHQKSVVLLKKLVEAWSSPGDTIFDPFMGSGTTGVACVQTGRNFIGCELDPKYFAIAEKRIADAQLQTRMNI